MNVCTNNKILELASMASPHSIKLSIGAFMTGFCSLCLINFLDLTNCPFRVLFIADSESFCGT